MASLVTSVRRSLLLVSIGICLLVLACDSGSSQSSSPSLQTVMTGFDRFNSASTEHSGIVGHIGSPAMSIQIRDDIAYLGHRAEFAVIDIADPTNPTRIGYLLLSTLDMVIEDSLAYVAGCDGMAVVDISSPSQPQILSFTPTAHSATSITKVQDTILLAVYQEGLQTIDVAEPAAPRLTNDFPINGRVMDLAVHDLHAYVVTNFGFQIIDFTDMTRPAVAGAFEVDRPVFSLATAGARAYRGANGGIFVLDATHAAQPAEVGWIPMAGTPLRMTENEDALFVATGTGVGIADLSTFLTDPVTKLVSTDAAKTSMPPELDWKDWTRASWDVAVAGNQVMVANGRNGIHSLQLEPNHGLQEVGTYAVPDAAYSLSAGDRGLYAVNGQGALWEIDVSQQALPIAHEKWRAPQLVHDVFAANNVVYLAMTGADHGICAIDMSAQALCDVPGVFATPGPVADIFASGDIVYLAVERVGLQAVDMSQPCHPQALDLYPVAELVNDAVIAEGTAYLALEGGRILIVDVSDPEAMVTKRAMVAARPIDHLAFQENVLYSATVQGEVQVTNITAEPETLAAIDLGIPIHDMVLADSRLHFATAEGIAIYAVGDGMQLALLHRVPVPGGAIALEVVGSTIHAAGGSNGLYILQPGSDSGVTS